MEDKKRKKEETEYLLKVGRNIKKIRLTKKLKQVELADYSDLDKQSIYRIETGQLNLTLKTLLRLAKALDTTVKDLVDF